MVARCGDCGREVEPVNHNGRGWRCPFCWGINLTIVQTEPPPPAPPPVKKRGIKGAAK